MYLLLWVWWTMLTYTLPLLSCLSYPHATWMPHCQFYIKYKVWLIGNWTWCWSGMMHVCSCFISCTLFIMVRLPDWSPHPMWPIDPWFFTEMLWAHIKLFATSCLCISCHAKLFFTHSIVSHISLLLVCHVCKPKFPVNSFKFKHSWVLRQISCGSEGNKQIMAIPWEGGLTTPIDVNKISDFELAMQLFIDSHQSC